MAETNGVAPRVTTPMQPVGTPGLLQWDGWVREEWLPELTGLQGIRTYKRMRDNSPIVGAILHATEFLLRPVPWSCRPADDSPEAERLAAFAQHSLFVDCLTPWYARLSDILSFLPFGWAFCEWTLKRRQGYTRDPWRSSQATDGLLGFADIGLRSQDSLLQWVIDDNDQTQAMVQQPPAGGPTVTIPRAKALLFRPTSYKGNPEGRALAPDTLIPTPEGWQVLDDIEIGQKVFDEQGRIRYVTARQEWKNRPCYRVKFSDRTDIVADANHVWMTQTLADRERGKVGSLRTTADIHRTLKTTQRTSNHSIPLIAPLDYGAQYLPVDPYFLGLWLGDGYARACQLATHMDDVQEITERLEKRGYRTRVIENGIKGGKGRSIRIYGKAKWATDGPSACLRTMGLFENKHIPAAYLHGSIEQRRALLAGLLDSDGTVDEFGRCEFNNTNMQLIAGVAEIVRSLGCQAFVSLRHRANGKDHKQDSFGVKFTPDWNPFFLSRKAARIKYLRARKATYIVAVEPVEPRRTICIEVDSPRHLFLAGEGMIPTHNSILRSAYRPWYNLEHIENIEGIGIERDLAGLPVVYVPPELLAPDASPQAKTLLETYKKMVTNIRRDAQEGIVFPLVYDAEGNQLYKIELLSTGGRRAFDTDTIIKRYELRIAQSVLADMILLGHEQVGSYALASSKTNLFATALGGYLHAIREVLQTEAISVLWQVNGLPRALMPTLEHGDVEHVDLKDLSEAVKNLAQAGFQVEDLERPVRLKMGLPAGDEEDG